MKSQQPESFHNYFLELAVIISRENYIIKMGSKASSPSNSCPPPELTGLPVPVDQSLNRNQFQVNLAPPYQQAFNGIEQARSRRKPLEGNDPLPKPEPKSFSEMDKVKRRSTAGAS